ncbi:uncharacterized protein LOC131842065 [Achroia grisella]|uniref:uncharacterized protein LOC131842065 n=1 Tax=Achroia grisella TaxID=688607 RepID=UPI0027D26EC8|nr:uncharacterized protein LOC131842065 [Achroia grisella]
MAMESLRKVVEDIAKENGFGKPEIVINPISTGGANYSSELFTIVVSEDAKETLHLFSKIIIINETIRAQMPPAIFDVERLIYVDLLKKYEDIEISHNVPPEKRLVVPKYYGCNTKKFEESVVLENLAEKGFITYDRFKSVDWEYAAKAVKSLAKFHALSMAYSEEYPQEFEEFVKKMDFQKEMFLGMFHQFYEQRIETTLSVTTEERKSKLKKYLDTHISVETIMKLSESSQRIVLSHGDYRPSNLMHKYNEDGTLQVIPVDFQTIQYTSPLFDLLYFIFTGSDEKFRRQHFQDLTDHYHQELSSALRYLGLNPDIIYPKRTYEYELKELLPYGLFVAIVGLPIITVELEDAPSMQGEGGFENMTSSKTGPLYPERMNGVINDFFRWGIIE